MNISEDQLRELVLRILKELEGETKQNIYMMCTSKWDESYLTFLRQMEKNLNNQVYAVIPKDWVNDGFEDVLRSYQACKGILYHAYEKSDNLEPGITVFPVAPRDIVVKTALCIHDTFETRWIASCIEEGSRVIFLQSGLRKFSGKEPEAYTSQILNYYRQVMEYGIEISDNITGISNNHIVKSEVMKEPAIKPQGKKRVLTASNVEQYATNGVLYLQPGDIVTDLAKEKATFRNIVLK